MTDIPKLEEITIQVRRDILRMVHANNSGHPGGSLGCAEYLVALYFDIMNHNKDFKMDGIEKIYFLSNGNILCGTHFIGIPYFLSPLKKTVDLYPTHEN